jgi:hypothetical protein
VEWGPFFHSIFREKTNFAYEENEIWNWRIKEARILLFAVASSSAGLRKIGHPWVPSLEVNIGEMGAIFPFYFHEKRQLS